MRGEEGRPLCAPPLGYAFANSVQGRMRQECLITILWPRAQPSTGKISPGVVFVAELPQGMNLLTSA